MGIFGSIFSRRETKRDPFDLSVFKVDMHSHLIPGIDDGSKSMDETIGMLTKFEALGFKKVITTPHIMSDYFRNTPEIILGGLAKVQAELKRINLNIEFEAAAEYYYDETLMEKLKNKEKLLTFGDNYLLFEFSFHSEPSQIDALIFEMITQNYKPVLAHFERYTFLHGSIDKATEWRAKGVNIQLNYNSLTGHYGPEVLKQARKLVDSGQIDFVATDCHRIEHLITIEDNLSGEYFHKLGELNLKNSIL